MNVGKLDMTTFATARIKLALIGGEQWRKQYNSIKLQNALGYRSPAPKTINRCWKSNPCTTIKSGPINRGRSARGSQTQRGFVEHSLENRIFKIGAKGVRRKSHMIIDGTRAY